MKRFAITLLFFVITVSSFAQSESFQTLKDHFSGKDQVESFSLSGFWCRAAMSIVMDDEEELKAMMKEIDQVRFMVIPKIEFDKQNLSVNGFRKFITKDSFEEVMSIREHGEKINIFHRVDGNKKNRYFVLIEQENEVVALELKGYIDPEMFKDGDNRISFN